MRERGPLTPERLALPAVYPVGPLTLTVAVASADDTPVVAYGVIVALAQGLDLRDPRFLIGAWPRGQQLAQSFSGNTGPNLSSQVEFALCLYSGSQRIVWPSTLDHLSAGELDGSHTQYNVLGFSATAPGGIIIPRPGLQAWESTLSTLLADGMGLRAEARRGSFTVTQEWWLERQRVGAP